MERRKFTREFKLEAGRLIKDRGLQGPQARPRRRRLPAARGCITNGRPRTRDSVLRAAVDLPIDAWVRLGARQTKKTEVKGHVEKTILLTML